MIPEILNEHPRIEIYQGDCLEIMKQIPDKSIDLVLTDPPYGITNEKWDKIPPKEYFNEILRISKEQLFFGGQFFDLPKKEGWIIWNKRMDWMKKKFTRNDINDGDLIWISKNIKTKIIDFHYWGNVQGFKGEKLKPDYTLPKNIFTSQKPIKLVKYLIETFFIKTKIILDPFMGSGTTGVACKELGRNFIGIEIEPKYYEIAKRRINQATTELFV